MPTRKQRRRAAKEKRHDYETVWVDAEGNELEEPPDEAVEAEAERRDAKGAAKDSAKSKGESAPQRGPRGGRVPQPPSWQRAGRRALILGAVVFALFYLTGGKSGTNRIVGAFLLALVYTLLFIPFTFAIDRFTYNRWQKRQQQPGGKKQSATKKR